MLIKEEVNTEKTAAEKNVLYQPLIIILIALIILMIISFLPADVNFAGLQIKSIDMISDVKPE